MTSHLYLREEHFECLQAMGPNSPYMTCEPKWLNYYHGPLLKEHYDQLWPSLIDSCKRRRIPSISQRTGPNGLYMTYESKCLNTLHGSLLKEHYDQLWPSFIICKRRSISSDFCFHKGTPHFTYMFVWSSH